MKEVGALLAEEDDRVVPYQSGAIAKVLCEYRKQIKDDD